MYNQNNSNVPRERERKVDIASAVFPGEVWRNSLYQRRKTLATPSSSSDGLITRAPCLRTQEIAVMFVHLLTKQVRQNQRQKQQQMAVIGCTSVSSSLLLVSQLLKNIGGCIVHRIQTCMCTVQDMAAR
jgi:hypothetical protein